MAEVPSRSIDVQVFPPFARRLSKAWLRDVVELALDARDEETPLYVSLVIADDETVHGLNRDYRGLDETTDVLAFPLWESRFEVEDDDGASDGNGAAIGLPPEAGAPAGEVVISYPQAARQARESRKRVRAEIALLVVHGTLHLLGYDHADECEQRRMWAVQDNVLAKVAVT